MADAKPDFGQPVRVGCAGWNVPREAARYFGSDGSHLERYAKVLNCCEINSSFYRPHRQATWERWSNSVPPGFKFSVKMPRSITHEDALNCSSESLLAFLQQTRFLGEKLGAVLIQLPPSLEFEPARARAFLSLLRDQYKGDVAWEPRHRSWFTKMADGLLREFYVARSAADPACVPSAAQPGGYPAFVYFRLHGSPRRYYSGYHEVFLNRVAGQITSLARGARVWCVFDNTAAGLAIQNALQLSSKLIAVRETR
jgi:uncharacterized protein YecE (DUF72 family)